MFKKPMSEVDAINEELKRLHDTARIMLEYPDRVLGDLLHSDVYADIQKLQDMLILIAKRRNGMEY
jgi:hypothetical protein